MQKDNHLVRLVTISLLFIFIFALISIIGSNCNQKRQIRNVAELVEAKCSACHFSTNIDKVKKTDEQWDFTVKRMQKMDPNVLTDEEVLLITGYLQKRAGNKF